MIIGLCGYAGAGKDYVYNYLQETSPLTVGRVAFADGVRDEVATEVLAAVGVDPLFVECGTWAKPYTDAQRWILQMYGTEYRRAQDPLYWVKRGLKVAHEALGGGWVDIVVITDVRFRNEAEHIQDDGGQVYEVKAPEHVRAERLGGILPPAHASEVIDFQTDGWIGSVEAVPYLPKGLADLFHV